MRKRPRRIKHLAHVPMLECEHRDNVAHTLGIVGDGVACGRCGMLLTWDELAEYMAGDRPEGARHHVIRKAKGE